MKQRKGLWLFLTAVVMLWTVLAISSALLPESGSRFVKRTYEVPAQNWRGIDALEVDLLATPSREAGNEIEVNYRATNKITLQTYGDDAVTPQLRFTRAGTRLIVQRLPLPKSPAAANTQTRPRNMPGKPTRREDDVEIDTITLPLAIAKLHLPNAEITTKIPMPKLTLAGESISVHGPVENVYAEIYPVPNCRAKEPQQSMASCGKNGKLCSPLLNGGELFLHTQRTQSITVIGTDLLLSFNENTLAALNALDISSSKTAQIEASMQQLRHLNWTELPEDRRKAMEGRARACILLPAEEKPKLAL